MLDGSWGGRMRACGEGVGVFAGTGMLARQDPQRGVRGVYRVLGCRIKRLAVGEAEIRGETGTAACLLGCW
ncbi:hypothetical protein BKA56DRAFT_587630 [Ilyonectria sp. MPI-CAGE-AT-0026]|nr:hypothetical protein BKA56DRAFT_587630 [Ilyonectria sp. MPI-CAGE-AT-0026]